MMLLPKQGIYRNKKYLTWVKTLPCVVSGQPAQDAHHIKRPGLGGGMKCSDLFTIPLTRFNHSKFHTVGWKSWEEEHGCQYMHVACTLAKAIEAINNGDLKL